jgi:hypothetical protein
MVKKYFLPKNKNAFVPRKKGRRISNFFNDPRVKLIGWTATGAGGVATSFALGLPQPTLAKTIGTAWAGGIFGSTIGLGLGMASSAYSKLKKKRKKR